VLDREFFMREFAQRVQRFSEERESLPVRRHFDRIGPGHRHSTDDDEQLRRRTLIDTAHNAILARLEAVL
jgi:hypothetical protein